MNQLGWALFLCSRLLCQMDQLPTALARVNSGSYFVPVPKQLHIAVEANVRWSKRQVLMAAETQRALQKDKTIRIVGAVYELATGKIRWLD